MFTHVSVAFILENICKVHAMSSHKVTCKLPASHTATPTSSCHLICKHLSVHDYVSFNHSEIRSQDSARA